MILAENSLKNSTSEEAKFLFFTSENSEDPFQDFHGKGF